MRQQLLYIFFSIIINDISNIFNFIDRANRCTTKFQYHNFHDKFLLKLKYIDKIHVEYNVNLLMKSNTINKKEIENFQKLQKNGGIRG